MLLITVGQAEDLHGTKQSPGSIDNRKVHGERWNPLRDRDILGGTMTNSNNLERPPPPSTVSPGQGLGAPDSAGKAFRACKGRAAWEAPAGPARAAEDHSGPVRDGLDRSILIKSGTKSEPRG